MANTSTLGAKLSGANENCWLRMGTHAARCNRPPSRARIMDSIHCSKWHAAIAPPPVQNLAQSELPRCVLRRNAPTFHYTLLTRSFLD